ncbi:alpha/beta fold hydrolase [Heyndrickxia camelliae]|nr:alpha/beta hydrolase [Heyndrickxia camelliae]
MLHVRGKNIYIEKNGADHLPKLLYLHGGPGSGCLDFTHFQASNLAKKVQLIALDQRGIGRSEGLAETDNLTLDDLVEDCEEIRKQLGIEKWSVLGHSFGAILAVLYAVRYPKALVKLIFECPTFDLKLSAKSLLKGAIGEYEKKENHVMVENCLKCIRGDQSSRETWELLMHLTNELGEDRENLYFKNLSPNVFHHIYEEVYGPPSEGWNKQGVFQQKLYQQDELFESFLPLLEKIAHPALLIKGKYDWVASEEQIEFFLKAVKHPFVEYFDQSAHFPHMEEKDRFTDVVSQFLNSEVIDSGNNHFQGVQSK